jgi:hypothetical protein
MDLYLQTGHGMMAHTKELISKWGNGTTIFSPKNMTLEQMISLSSYLNANNGSVMIDPQFYVPRTSQKKLFAHSFWPQSFETNMFFNGSGVDTLIDSLLNDYIIPTESSAFIIPTLYLSEISQDWSNITDVILNSIEKKSISIPTYLTICLSEDILLNDEKTHELIEIIEDYPVDGFYIIPIHPKDSYLVDNSTWLFNLLDIIASLKSLNKKVIVAYSGHQSLILSLAKVDAICSGTYLKTRMFPLKDFDENDNEPGGGRKTTWYYCPQSLSEYQTQFLDVANRAGILNNLKASDSYKSTYSDILFSGAQPTTVNFTEKEAFRHYLDCLRQQCSEVTKAGYLETKEYLKLYLETASDLSNYFFQNGVRAKYRDFANIADSTLSVIDAFDASWGLSFQAKWGNI